MFKIQIGCLKKDCLFFMMVLTVRNQFPKNEPNIFFVS